MKRQLIFLRLGIGLVLGPISNCVASPPAAPAGEEPAAAEASRDDQLWALSQTPEIVTRGKETYATFCFACHGAEGLTVDSPSNLFDPKWYHRAEPSGIEQMIHVGYIDAGMPGWGAMIPHPDIEAVTAYLLSFQSKPTTQK